MNLLIVAPDIFDGDAVGNHCFGISRYAQRFGMAARLYSERFNRTEKNLNHIESLFHDIKKDDVLLISYSTYDSNLSRLINLPNFKICYFHGITNPKYLLRHDPIGAQVCDMGYKQLPLINSCNKLVANSKKSKRVLRENGISKPIEIVPPIFSDMDLFTGKVHRQISDKLRLLMVGRVVPHKFVEDGISVLQLLRSRGIDATLTVVGALSNYNYFKFLINYGQSLNVLRYIFFLGLVDISELKNCYEKSDILLVMSQDEGFCIPAIEASYFGLKVFGRSGTALDEICPARNTIKKDEPLKAIVDKILNKNVSDSGGHQEGSKLVKESFFFSEAEIWKKIFDTQSLDKN